MIAIFAVSSAMAEDLTTVKGETFRNVTVTRVEPDGIAVKHAAGIAKIPFSDLPKEWQEKYGYEPQKAAQYSAAVADAINRYNRTQPALSGQSPGQDLKWSRHHKIPMYDVVIYERASEKVVQVVAQNMDMTTATGQYNTVLRSPTYPLKDYGVQIVSTGSCRVGDFLPQARMAHGPPPR